MTASLLEDEIWSRIRIDPQSLPVGKVSIVPSTIISRLLHRPVRAEEAEASLSPADQSLEIMVYQLHYPEAKRTLKIHFEKNFPHTILEWEESYPGISWGTESKTLHTRAKLKKTLLLDYWRQNQLEDRRLREALGLS
ncbi:MAG: hypothetical protein HC880_11760 [Bacteroidia bacterium]|nr:hypothetical protein [Bacteroidia bacterium]